MKIISRRRYFFIFSGILVLVSLVLFFLWGLKLGIDFTGGALMELNLQKNQISKEVVRQKLNDLAIAGFNIQFSSEGNALVRFATDGDEKNLEIRNKIIEKLPEVEITRTEFISSIISQELRNKTFRAIFLAIIGIVIYIALAFRKVSYPVKSWKYGLAAVIALAHDIIITVGVFVFLGKYWNLEVGVAFIAALLTILGYSVNDTIVVFDRIRENLLRAGSKENFEETVNKSINETLGRSINTSLTVILVLLALIFWGGTSLFEFSLALLVGVFFGTYSSIFVASALLVEFWQRDLAKR